MDAFIINQFVNLSVPNPPMYYTSPRWNEDAGAHTWRVHVFRGREAQDLTGCTISCYMRQDLKLEDGSFPPAVLFKGEAEGGMASALLPADVYAMPGALIGAMRASTADGQTVTLATLYLVGDHLMNGDVYDPTGVLPSIEQLLAQIEAMEAATAETKAATEEAKAVTANAVLSTAQELTDAQQLQARANIGAAASEDVAALTEGMSAQKNVNAALTGEDLCPRLASEISSHGVTFTPTGQGILIDGTAASSAYGNMFQSVSKMPTGIRAGRRYYVQFDGVKSRVNMQIRWVDSAGTYEYLMNSNCSGYVDIPQAAVGLQIRIYVATGAVVTAKRVAPRIFDCGSVAYARRVLDRDCRPMLSIIYDDGHAEFYEHILPIIRAKGVPIGTAVITDYTENGTAGFMTYEQIGECYKAGAEVLAHCRQQDEATWNQSSTQQIAGYYQSVKNILRYNGFAVPDVLVFSGGSAGYSRCGAAARMTYRAGFAAGGDAINYRGEFDPYFIQRYSLIGRTLDDLKAWVDELIAADTGWMVWMGHNSNASTDDPAEAAAILSDAIDYALAQNVRIVTVERGLNEYLDV